MRRYRNYRSTWKGRLIRAVKGRRRVMATGPRSNCMRERNTRNCIRVGKRFCLVLTRVRSNYPSRRDRNGRRAWPSITRAIGRVRRSVTVRRYRRRPSKEIRLSRDVIVGRGWRFHPTSQGLRSSKDSFPCSMFRGRHTRVRGRRESSRLICLSSRRTRGTFVKFRRGTQSRRVGERTGANGRQIVVGFFRNSACIYRCCRGSTSSFHWIRGVCSFIFIVSRSKYLYD